MQSHVSRWSKAFLMVVFLLGFFGIFSTTHAENASTGSTPPAFMQDVKNKADFDALTPEQQKTLNDFMSSQSKAVTVATVNVQDIKILTQDNTLFSIFFNISNREGVQPQIIYAVDLFQKDEQGNITIIDQKIYDDDILSLGTKETAQKLATYTAPAYLKGEYFIAVEARNSDGLNFGRAQAPETVTLTGTNENIQIDQSTCFLTVDGEAGDKHYTLSQGVDIAAEESLIAHCTITNTFKTDQTLTPTFYTHYHSAFGKTVSVEKQKPMTFKSGETEFTVNLPKVTKAQMYHVTLTFFDENNVLMASPVSMFYSTQGAAANIQNLIIDKDYYQKGESANITFYWSGIAEGLPILRNVDAANIESQVAEKSLDTSKSFSAIFTLVDERKNACAKPFTKTLAIANMGGVENIAIAITDTCKNPSITAKIVDSDDTVLAENVYDIVSKDALQTQTAAPNSSKANQFFAPIIYGAFFLLIIALALYLVKKNKRVGMIVLLGLMIGTGIFVGAGEAKADTFTVGIAALMPGGKGPGWSSVGGWVDFVVGTDKGNYTTGENIIANGSYTCRWAIYPYCPYSLGTASMSLQTINLSATISGQAKIVLSTSQGSAPTSLSGAAVFSATNPGNCGASFNASVINYYGATFVIGYGQAPWFRYGGVGVSGCNIVAANNPPNTPNFWGPTSVNINTNTGYGMSATDPDGNNLLYYVNWGDGQAGWITGWVGNGSNAWPAHSWSTTGTKTITSYAYDTSGVWSPARTYTVNVIDPTPSGNLTASNCTMTVGTNYCLSNISFGTSNVPSPNLYNATSSTVLSNNTSGSVQAYVYNGAATVQVRNGSTVLASANVTAVCAIGLTWNGSLCVLPPVINIFSANPTTVPLTQSSTLTWTTSNATACWGSGAGDWTGWKTINALATQSVRPTAIGVTNYTLECWNSAGVSSGQRFAPVTATCVDVWPAFDPTLYCPLYTAGQTSSCGNTRTVNGTGPGVWTPPASGTCSSLTVTQTRCGDEARIITGTKDCKSQGWREIAPTN